MLLRSCFLFSLAFTLGGCASTLSTLQTARPVERGHVQVTGGVGLYVHTGTIASVVDTGISQGRKIEEAARTGQPYTLSEEDQQQLLTAGIGIAVMPPSPSFEISARTGILPTNWDVGIRYSSNALRLDTKYRLFHADDSAARGAVCAEGAQGGIALDCDTSPTRSTDIAVGIGVSKYFFGGPVFEVLEWVKLDDFSRWDVEVPIYFSKEFGDVFKLFGAAKYVYSHTTMDQTLVDVANEAPNVAGLDISLPGSVDTHFIGASGGIAVGYKYVHVMLELTAGYTIARPVVMGAPRNLSGVTLYPAIGLNFRM